MEKTQIQVAATRAAGAVGGAWQKKPPVKEWCTVVVYERKRTKTVVLYVGRETFAFKVPAGREVRGVVEKAWTAGGVRAYSMRVRAVDVAELIIAYAYEEATRKISLLDPVFRAAARQGLWIHSNDLYVKLWLEHPLGAELFPIGDPRERELGACIKSFTHSFGIWRMVTPPWAARC
jgi:hypothetical protein